MNIEKVKLYNFRSYKKAEVDFPEGITVIYGENAKGKTNLLESVYMICCGRSMRSRTNSEIIKTGELESSIKSSFNDGNIKHNCDIRLYSDGKKKITLDGEKLKRTSELVGTLRCVLFSPDNIGIIKEGAQGRRNYIDVALSQLYPAYLKDLSDYNRILLQRNALLKNTKFDSELNNVFEESLAFLGVRIIERRKEFSKYVSLMAYDFQKMISVGEDVLKVIYVPSVKIQDELSYEEKKNVFLEVLKNNREKDKYRGYTSIGPQRDDLELLINGMQARNFASQGQQRTAALSLKLAELEYMKKITGRSPVLLLDDVFGELDIGRREKLLESINDCQTIITCTNAESLPLESSRVKVSYSVENLNKM